MRAGEPSGVTCTSATRAVGCAAADVGHFSGASFLDGDLAHAVGKAPVDGRGGQGDIEGHAIVMRRQRLEIGADLVADVAGARGAVGADDGQIDQPVLHEMAAGVVGDHRMRHPFAQQFESGEARALIARARLIDPDMDRDSGARRLVNRRQRRAPVDGREPAGVAMGEDVHGATGIPAAAARMSRAP